MAGDYYAAGGRYRIRIREVHVRDRLAPLLAGSAHGAAKLDLVLRGLAALPDGDRPPGQIDPSLSWEDLHDLVRAPLYGNEVILKRKWVTDKLARLQALHLVRRVPSPGRRPDLIVLRDDGSRKPLDDPSGGGDDSYVTVLGTLVEFDWLRIWRSPEVTAYLAAMTAERYARADPVFAAAARLNARPIGGGLWYRPLRWFADPRSERPPDHVRYPFSERTLKRGFAALRRAGLVTTEWLREDPRTDRPFRGGPRPLYWNGFHDLRPSQPRGRPLPFRITLQETRPARDEVIRSIDAGRRRETEA